MNYSVVMDSPVGKLGIVVSEKALQRIDFLPNDATLISGNDSLAKKVESQLNAYFKDGRFTFDLPLEIMGRPFQKTVWCALRKIPSGKTKTYSELSSSLDSGPRAVGNACRRNPIPIIIPCHRIVAKNGLGGFAGETAGEKMRIKQWLLAHEVGKI